MFYFLTQLISFLLLFSAIWSLDYFGLSCFEQIVYHTKCSLQGTNKQFIFDWFKLVFIKSLIITLIINVFIYYLLNISSYIKLITIVIVILCLILAAYKVGLIGYIINLFRYSDIYEKYYVAYDANNITSPVNKKNLIYIYVESLETTYSDIENGGNSKDNLIPNLTKLAKDNISFSNNNKLGGAKVVAGTGWTTGGIVASSCGIPLLLPLNYPSLNINNKLYKGITSLGDILENDGYNQVFMIGSKACFGGRDIYFKQHGNYEIYDYDYAINNNYIDKNYHVFWGLEDNKLFAMAKDKLVKLAKDDKPFNFTMLTVDTHHPYGYKDGDVSNQYKDDLSNIIKQEDIRLNEFINWIKKQDFYNNTVIVISGDHTSMAAQYIKHNYDTTYDRRIYNCFINTGIDCNNTKNKEFNTMDMFATTLKALGYKIKNNRIAFSTDLFSNEKTLSQQLGHDYIDKQLRKQSKYFKEKIL